MTSIRRAAVVGFNMEAEWNERARTCGFHTGLIPVPPLRYRVARSLHMTQMAARERLALTIAPWLDPDDNDLRIEAHLS